MAALRQWLSKSLLSKPAGAKRLSTEQSIPTGAYAIPPPTWYPLARSMGPRVLHAALGPTNSAKTANALHALSESKSGIYCAPLRLLAAEVAAKLNARGVPCNLVTGQERKLVPNAQHTACTVEMVDTSTPVETGVVDEIQLIGDDNRGWAWTRAMLGLPAHHVHLCGAPAAQPILEHLSELTGDSLHIRYTKRLSKLQVAPSPISLSQLRKGDAVVAFSRRALFKLKASIEANSSLRVAIIYGSLPPATRGAQAARFNSGAAPVLVASDAIGMGLNLSIRRVVFAETSKFDGTMHRPLSPSEVAQIAGRAGRSSRNGIVTAFKREDLSVIAAALNEVPEPVTFAGLSPPFEAVEAAAESSALAAPPNHPPPPLHHTLRALVEESTAAPPFFACDDAVESIDIAKALAEWSPSLTIREQWTFATAPADADNATVMAALQSMCDSYVKHGNVPLTSVVKVPATIPRTEAALASVESAAKVFDLWKWLSLRLSGFTASNPDAVSEALHTAITAGLEAHSVAVLASAKSGISGRRRGPQRASPFAQSSYRARRGRRDDEPIKTSLKHSKVTSLLNQRLKSASQLAKVASAAAAATVEESSGTDKEPSRRQLRRQRRKAREAARAAVRQQQSAARY